MYCKCTCVYVRGHPEEVGALFLHVRLGNLTTVIRLDEVLFPVETSHWPPFFLYFFGSCTFIYLVGVWVSICHRVRVGKSEDGVWRPDSSTQTFGHNSKYLHCWVSCCPKATLGRGGAWIIGCFQNFLLKSTLLKLLSLSCDDTW